MTGGIKHRFEHTEEKNWQTGNYWAEREKTKEKYTSKGTTGTPISRPRYTLLRLPEEDRKGTDSIWRNNVWKPKFDDRYEYKYLKCSKIPSKMNSKRPTLRHIIIKLSKDQERESWKLEDRNESSPTRDPK